MVVITTLTSIGLATLLSLLGWTLNRLVTGFDARLVSLESSITALRGDMEFQIKDLRGDIASLREDHARLEGKMDGLLARKID